MTRTDFAGMACSIARSAALIGDPWSLLVVRDIALGLRRFDELQQDLGVATNTLTDRLERLVTGGVLVRERYSRRPDRYEYALTEKGRQLVPILLALTAWGDRWESAEEGPPLVVRHHTCGEVATAEVTCSACGDPVALSQVDFHAGPGGRTDRGTALLSTRLGPRT
ncbi:helix-turn-helix domain-containing protein [Actinosynnema sp. NPDC049800]|jgi:DNA-binding HxlR family transcriptional regulator